jgi:hypothetical protein
MSEIKKFKTHYNLTRITGYLHEDRCTFFIITRSVLRRMGIVSGESCIENQDTHFMLNVFFFENRSVYDIIWKNIVEPDKPQMTTRHMRIALCLT